MAARLSPRDRLLRAIPEEVWRVQVEGYARAGAWMSFHAPDNRPVRSARGQVYVQNVKGGWPDEFLARDGRLVALELKKELGAFRPGQVDWLLALQAGGVEVAVVRPSDAALVIAVLLHGAPLPRFERPAGQ